MGVNLNPAPINWRKMLPLDFANPVSSCGQPHTSSQGSGTKSKQYQYSAGDHVLIV